MGLFYGSVLVNVEYQWLISKEIHESSNGQNVTSQRYLLVEELEEKEDNPSKVIFYLLFFSF
jgi:hypothetical protein